MATTRKKAKRPKTEAEWNADRLLKFAGATITGATVDPSGEMFGIVVALKGKETVLWVLRDPEGNGCGFIDPQEQK